MKRRLMMLTLLIGLSLCRIATAAVLQWYNPEDWNALRSAHASRPWVVHLWGMSCDPCLQELPAWGQFLHDHPTAQVTFIEVEKAAPSDVQLALERAGLTGSDQWLSADGFDAAQRFAISRRWRGEIPMTLLIAPDGNVQTLLGAMDFRRLDAWLGVEK